VCFTKLRAVSDAVSNVATLKSDALMTSGPRPQRVLELSVIPVRLLGLWRSIPCRLFARDAESQSDPDFQLLAIHAQRRCQHSGSERSTH
jgi:hypothetical protein